MRKQISALAMSDGVGIKIHYRLKCNIAESTWKKEKDNAEDKTG